MISPDRSRVGTFLKGFVVVVFATTLGLIAFGWNRLQELQRANESLRATNEVIARLQEENRELQKLRVANDELERLRKQTEEIHKLRGQYQEWQRLRGDYAALQKENERLRVAQQQTVGALQQQLSQALRDQAVAAAVRPAPLPSVWIGVALQPLPDGTPPGSGMPGVMVQSVMTNGPAANSGLAVGDMITAVDNKPVTTVQQLRDEIGAKQVGQLVGLDILRNGAALRIGVTTAAFPR